MLLGPRVALQESIQPHGNFLCPRQLACPHHSDPPIERSQIKYSILIAPDLAPAILVSVLEGEIEHVRTGAALVLVPELAVIEDGHLC